MTADLLPPSDRPIGRVPRKLTSVRSALTASFMERPAPSAWSCWLSPPVSASSSATRPSRHSATTGFRFFTQTQWLPELDKIGIAAVLVGTAEVALVAMVVSFPLALGLALFISDYSPSGASPGWSRRST